MGVGEPWGWGMMGDGGDEEERKRGWEEVEEWERRRERDKREREARLGERVGERATGASSR